MPSWTSAIRFAMKNPGTKVPGTNDFTCKPRKGTHPVVLIPGTSEDAFITWSYYGPRLKAAGFCAYTFNYNPETHPLVEAAETSGNTSPAMSSNSASPTSTRSSMATAR